MRSLPFVPDVATEPAWIGLSALVDASLKGLVLLLCAAALALVLRRASAATRHLVWSLAFAGLLVLPLLSSVLPTWRVPVLPSAPPAAESVFRVPVEAAVVTAPIDAVQPRREPASAARSRTDYPWARGVLLVWLVGALLVLGSLLLGTGRLWWLARRARSVTTGPWAALAQQIRAELELRRPVRLIESAESAMPMAWGIVRPTVLIPAAARDWPIARQRAMLLHELAHVQRHDCLSQLAVELACALYWFNPLVWVAARRVRIEREHACDDQVLRTGAKASDYASQLLEVARSLRAARGTAFAAVAMARRSQLRGRLLAILDEHRRREPASRWLALSTSFAAVGLILPLATLSPVDGVPEIPTRESAAGISKDNVVAAFVPDPLPYKGTKTIAAPPKELSSASSAVGPSQPARVVSATEVQSEQEIQEIARELSGSDEEIESTARRLRRLFGLDGTSLYLQFNNRSGKPFDVRLAPLAPSDNPRKIAMPFGKATLHAEPETPDPRRSLVVVVWDRAQEVYTLHVRASVTHVTIVADGRVIANAQPLGSGTSLVARGNCTAWLQTFLSAHAAAAPT